METIRVRVLFFARYRDLAGAAEREVEMPAGATAAELVAHLRADDAGLERLPAEPVVAVNQEYADLSSPLHEGDEVALLPPVAGG